MDKATSASLAADLRAEMARQQIKLKEVSEQTGIPYMNLHRRLNGQATISVDDLRKIADCLDVDPADLIGRRSA